MNTVNSLEKNLCRRTNLGSLFTYNASVVPDKPALKFGERKYNYVELNQAANRLANALLNLGINKGDRATILSHNCDLYGIIWIACLKIGVILTPINWMYKGNEIMYVVNHCEPKIFFVEDILVNDIENLKKEIKSVKTYVEIQLSPKTDRTDWIDCDELISDEKDMSDPEVIIDDNDPALLMYTSGTESAPKGVLKSHLDIMSGLMTIPMNVLYQKDDVQLVGLPLFHFAGLWSVVSAAAIEGLLVLMYEPKLEDILELTHKERVNLWVWPVTVYVNLLQVPGFEKYELKSLSMCTIFGSAVPPELIKKWKEIRPGIQFQNGYGLTESSHISCIIGEEYEKRLNSVGKPKWGQTVKIFDEDGNEAPRGQVGEIVVRAPTNMLGYYRDEEKTAETMRGGWLHTSDLGYMDEEGWLYFSDRIKDMVKTGGENVASAEVEKALYEHSQILEVAIVGLPHSVWAEAVTAVVVPVPGENLKEEELIAWCKERMAGFKVPKKVFIVDELPKNPTGKILKKDLREKYKNAFSST
ncbi:AMP-binding protein [Thermodesulfobacteriota bacterium]